MKRSPSRSIARGALCLSTTLFAMPADAAITMITAQHESCVRHRNINLQTQNIPRCVVDTNADVTQKKPPQANYPQPNNGTIEGTPISYATLFDFTIGFDESDGSGRAEVATDGSFDGVHEAGWLLELTGRCDFTFDTDQPETYVFQTLHHAPGTIATISLFDVNDALVDEVLIEHLTGATTQLTIPAAGVYTLDVALGTQETAEAPLGHSTFSAQPIGLTWAPVPEPASAALLGLGGLMLAWRRR